MAERDDAFRLAAARDAAGALRTRFEAAGALCVETAALQPADLLLDLYGEDIRARAFVTRDPVHGEFMLRPDYTVPVARMHMTGKVQAARYTYLGPVWRMQPPGSLRPAESLQVGYELFDHGDRAAADAEVFGLMADILASDGLDMTVGDMGILIAAVAGLDTPERRKAALRRHLWRPNRFRRLLEQFCRPDREPARETGAADAGTRRLVGLRSREEIDRRLGELELEARTPPLAAEEVTTLAAVLDLRGTLVTAMRELEGLAAGMPALLPAVETMAARADALRSVRVDVDGLRFDASHGRANMEYYDGFVFGFRAASLPGRPVVASGGRYDALTGVLGRGRQVPAVGGVIRPEVLAAVRSGTS